LSVTVQDLGDVSVLRCTGRITLGDTDTLRTAVRHRLLASTIVLDLAGVTAIDAAGLGTLVDLRSWAVANGTDLKLMNLTPTVEEVLRVTNLVTTFEVCSFREMMDLLCRALRSTEPSMPRPEVTTATISAQ
jgi:anti-anti-sigma factor